MPKEQQLYCTNSEKVFMTEWYWNRGLHDAIITKKEKNILAKSVDGVYYSNYFVLHIDASNALFDTSIKAILFYNCKELSNPAESEVDGWIWKADTLSFDGEKYLLSVELQKGMNKKTYSVRFSKCDVQR